MLMRMYRPERYNAGPFARFHAHLERSGRSVTRNRDLVFGALVRLGACRVRDLADVVPERSLYRTVKLFVEIGIAEMIRQDVIRLRAPIGVHGHFMVCEQCGRQIGFNDERLERELGRLAAAREFAADGHRVELQGQCRVCQATPAI